MPPDIGLDPAGPASSEEAIRPSTTQVVFEPREAPTTRYERKRETILDAAATLFNARGLGGVTIGDVAQSVGLTTTSLTYYYRRKEDLAAACLMRVIAEVEALVTKASTEPTAAGRIRSFLAFYFGMLAEVAEGRGPAGINFWDLRALTGPQAETTMAAFVELFRRFRELLHEDDGSGLSRTEQNARAHLVFSAVIRSKGWVSRYEPADYPRAAARMADVLLKGVAGPGREWAPVRLGLVPVLATDAGAGSREAFLRAATELLNEHGYRGASVDRISARLNVTKGSFYHHNETKDDLVSACFERTFDVIRQAHEFATEAAGDGWSRLCAISAALVGHQLSQHGPLLRLSALSATVEGRRPGLLAAFERLSEKTAGVISDGIADGSIRAVDAVVAAELVTGMINASAELTRWAPAVKPHNAAALFARPLLVGVFAPPASRG